MTPTKRPALGRRVDMPEGEPAVARAPFAATPLERRPALSRRVDMSDTRQVCANLLASPCHSSGTLLTLPPPFSPFFSCFPPEANFCRLKAWV
eukprot:847752-Prorocentrum_minimum.AAC.1